jgi:hypothetical protein
MLPLIPVLASAIATAQAAPPADPLNEILDAALGEYFAGNLESARSTLRRLVLQPEFQQHPSREKGYLALAEVEYYLGERDASWATCVALLGVNPDYKIDPFVHPPEIVAFFESVRATLSQNAPRDDTSELLRVPAWAVLFPGAIQIHNDQRVLGTITLGVVGALSATSTSLFIALRRYDLDLAQPGIQVATLGDQAQADELLTWTNATRWAVAGLWSASLIHGLVSSAGTERSTGLSWSPGSLHFQW